MKVVTQEGGRAVIRPSGDSIIAASVNELRTGLRGLLDDGVRNLVVDLTDVRMVDSSGIGLLISAYNSLRKVGGHLEVVHVSPELLELFQTMRMHQHFAVSGN